MSRGIAARSIVITVAILSVISFAMLSEYSDEAEAATYTVSFDPNGGYLNTDDPSGYYRPTTDTGRLYIPGYSFPQGGYNYDFNNPAGTFSTWNTQADGKGINYSPGSLMKVTSDTTLYAIWSPNNYTLSLVDDAEGTFSVLVYYGSTFSTGPLNYTKSGYVHVGWSTSPPTLSGDVYVTSSGEDFYTLDIVYDKAYDLTLYPVYAKVHDLSLGAVTINDNGYHYVSEISGNAAYSNNIQITGGSPSVILDNVTMVAPAVGNVPVIPTISPINISPGAELHLTLWGSNSLEGSHGYSWTKDVPATSTAAVRVQAGASLVITEYSTGGLTAKGGNAESTANKTGAYAGSGIGSNGATPILTCGTITINGGHIIATGGAAINNHPGMGNESNLIDPGAGIGGYNAVLHIESGFVDASFGMFSGNSSYLRVPATSLEGSSITYGTGAAVVLHDGQTYQNDVAVVEFSGLATAIATQSISVNGISYSLFGELFGPVEYGGLPTISVPLDSIANPCQVVLIASNGDIYSGTAVLDTTFQDGVKYTVTLTLSSQSLKQVTIMASRDPDGTGTGGSVTPYGNQAFPTSSTSFAVYASPSLGYRISHVETSPDGVTWSALPTADYEIVNGQVIISTITNGMRYSVAFVPQTFTATVSATMPNNLSWTGASQQISSSGAISWSLNTATISPISYNSNLVVSIDTKTSGNPYILKYVTVNGAVYIPTDKGSGVYEVSIGSVKSDIAIEITFAETIKLTFDYSDPLFSLDPGNYFVLYDKDSKNPQAVEPSNNFYVEKGTSRMFSVFFGEDTSDLCVFELMVGSNLIPIQTLYETGRMDADTEVSINLDYWEHETTINYWGGSYRIGTVNLSPLILPSQAEMETLGYMKPGYNISGWTNVSGGTTPVYTPGAQITVTSSVEYWPVWSLSQYGITYDMNGGDLPVPGSNPDVFDINDAPFALASPTRTGYGPGHWELPDGTAISFVDPTVHHWDLTLKAVWGSPNSYTVTLMDGTVIGTVSVTYGDNYHSLPILPAKSGYSFSGWSLDTEGTDRVVSLTVVNKGEDHNLYAVWAPTNTWIIELAGSNNQSGQFSAPSYVVKGNEALLVVIPNTGYGIDSIVLTGSGAYRLENDPAQYSFSGTNVTIPVPGCSEGSYMSFWVTPSEDIVIGAVLSPIEYTVTVGCDLCGTEALGHGHVYSYTIETSSWVVPVPTVPHTNSFFLGWSGTGITGVSGDPLIIQLGSTGDRTYSANWQMSTKAIQYFLPGGNLSDPVREYVPGGTVITFATPVWTGYTFMGWYTDPGYVPGSEIYSTEGRTDVLNLYAKFQINQYTITFDSDGGSPVSSMTQDYGTAVTAPAAPTKTGYTFSGWYPAVPATMPAGNVTIVAQWTVNQYTITWNVDGTETTQLYDYGATPAFAGSTDKDPTAQYTYTFTGWDPAIAAVAGDQTYTAQYSSVVNQYTITWTVEGVTTDTQVLDYGATPVYAGVAPTKAADAQYTYAFSGWDPVISTVTGHQTYAAVFTETLRAYTITWSVDGVTTTTQADHGTMPAYAGTPAKAATPEYTYAFAGWTPGLVEATADTTYTAEFTATPVDYTITFDSDGGSAVGTMTVAFGAAVTAPTAPTKTGYAFSGWSPALPATMPAEDLSVTATWTIVTYTITFDSAGGSAVTAITQDYGTAITPPADPTWVGHYFVGWDTELPMTMPAENMTITAVWKTKVDIPVAVSGLVYNGLQQTGFVAATGYTLTGNTGTDAGDYTATAALADGYIWSDASTAAKTISWNITPYVGSLIITFESVYEGSPTEPPVIVKDDLGATLIRDVDYSVSYENNTGTGTATVIVTGMGNYLGTTETSHFEVTAYTLPNDLGHVVIKDRATGKVLGPKDIVYQGQKLIVTPSSKIEGDYVIYDWQGNSIGSDGDYTVSGPVYGPFTVEGIPIPDPENVGEWGTTLGISLIILLILLRYVRYRMRSGP